MVRRLVLLALLASAAPAMAAAQAVPTTIGSNPFVIEGQTQDANSTAKKMRLPGCKPYLHVTEKPSLSFTLKKAVSDDIEVRLTGANIVLMLPGNRHVCLNRGAIPNKFLNQPGTYAVHALETEFGDNRHSSNKLTPVVAFQNVAELAKSLEQQFVPVKLDFARNPVQLEVPLKQVEPVTKRLAGLDGCFHEDKVVPGLAFTLDEASQYRIAYNQTASLVGPDGKCIKLNGNNAIELQPGNYKLWRTVHRRTNLDAPMRLTVHDAERPLAFPGVKTVTYGKKTSEIISYTYSAPATHPFGPTCKELSQEPIVLLKAKGKKEKVRVGQLYGRGRRLLFVGPLETSGSRVRCSEYAPNEYQGTYALFARSQEEDVGHAALLVLGDKNGKPLERTADIGPDLPLKEREIKRFYGWYFNRTGFIYYGLGQYGFDISLPLDPIFADAPKELFVFAKSPKGGLQEGEPLLLQSFGEDKSSVVRLDGSVLKVRTSALTTEVPEAVTFAVTPSPIEVPKDLKEGLQLTSPPHFKLLEQLEKKYQKYNRCYDRYRAKNDPSYGKSYDLINTRTGANVGDKWHARARKKCKYKKHQQQETKTIKKIVKARNADQKKAVAAMKKKFK